MAEVGCATADEQRARACLDHRCEGGMELALASGFHGQNCRPMARPAVSTSRNTIVNCGYHGLLQHGDDSGFGT